MKWFSGLNNHNREKYLDYIKMYTVAVVSAKETNPLIEPYLIFDGVKDEYIEMSKNFNTILSEINDENNKIFNLN